VTSPSGSGSQTRSMCRDDAGMDDSLVFTEVNATNVRLFQSGAADPRGPDVLCQKGRSAGGSIVRVAAGR
jgi:hypothetical protein